jgi:hypothetical protein
MNSKRAARQSGLFAVKTHLDHHPDASVKHDGVSGFFARVIA